MAPRLTERRYWNDTYSLLPKFPEDQLLHFGIYITVYNKSCPSSSYLFMFNIVFILSYVDVVVSNLTKLHHKLLRAAVALSVESSVPDQRARVRGSPGENCHVR